MEAGEEVEAEWSCCKELRGWLAEQGTMHLENRLVLETAANTGGQKASAQSSAWRRGGVSCSSAGTILDFPHNTLLFLFFFNKEKVTRLNYG